MSGMHALPDTVGPRRRILRKVRERGGDAWLLQVERATRALYVELAGAIAEVEAEQPELAVWLTTAIWMLEMAAKELAAERDPGRRRAGISVALLQAMRISCGLELTAAMGYLDGELARYESRVAAIFSRLEQARDVE
ncbi:MAG: hypothetical protein M3Y87_31460 [Myxococcota bacterium]|nr:hypothetical protein [Myxococcota bacterium]